MAAAFDANLLVTDTNTGGITPITFNTTAVAAANTKVIVLASYFEATANLITAMTIGGTAAALDTRKSNGSDRFDIWSADKAAGMASASAIQLTMPSNTGGGLLLGAVSFTGLATGAGSVVTISSAASTGTSWSSGSATNTGFADALFIGGSGNEAVATTVPWAVVSGTKIHDRYRTADGQGFSTGYTIASSVASRSISGTWASTSTANTGALVIYAALQAGVSGSSVASGPGVAGEFHPHINYRMWL